MDCTDTVLSFYLSDNLFYKKDTLVQAAPKACINCGTVYDGNEFICPNCKCTDYTLCEVQQDKNQLKRAKTWSKISVCALIIAIILFFVLMAVAAATGLQSDKTKEKSEEPEDITHYAYYVNGTETYYDMFGNAYTNANDVLYYDKYGNSYVYDRYTGNFRNGRIEYSSFKSYVDTNGYFVYNNNFDIKLKSSNPDAPSEDSNGNEYFYYFYASWDADGNLVDSYTGEPLFK